MSDLTDAQIAQALARFGNYRTKRVNEYAGEGPPDGISGALILALGLRETQLRNVEGGAVFKNGVWVPSKSDTGWTQINRDYHRDDLRRMPGVKAGTWTPVVAGHTALDIGYCPRFSDALRFTLDELHDAMAVAEDHGVPEEQRPRFAVAAHNAGMGGALKGYSQGDVDRYTAGGDYSAWVLRHRSRVAAWLRKHPNWK